MYEIWDTFKHVVELSALVYLVNLAVRRYRSAKGLEKKED